MIFYRNKEFVDAFKKKQTDVKKKKKEKKKAIKSSASTSAASNTNSKDKLDQDSKQSTAALDKEADLSAKDETPIKKCQIEEIESDPGVHEDSKESKEEIKMPHIPKNIDIQKKLEEKLFIEDSVACEAHATTEDSAEVKLLQNESGSTESVHPNVCSATELSSNTLPPINPRPDVSNSSENVTQPSSSGPKTNPILLDCPETERSKPLLESEDCLSSFESKPYPSLDPKPNLNPLVLKKSDLLDRLKSERNPNLSSTDCSLTSRPGQDHLPSLDVNPNPSQATPGSISTPEPEPIIDPMDRLLESKSDLHLATPGSALTPHDLFSRDVQPKSTPLNSLEPARAHLGEVDFLALKQDLDAIMQLDEKTRAEILDRPITDRHFDPEKLKSVMSPDDFKGDIDPKDAAQFLLSKLDIKRTLEIYSKLGISVKDYPLAELPILIKEATDESPEIPFLLEQLPDKTPYPEAEEKLLKLAVEKIAYEAVASHRAMEESEPEIDDDLKEKTDEDLKQMLKDIIKARLMKQHGIEDGSTIHIIDKSDPRYGGEENVTKFQELLTKHAMKSKPAIEDIPTKESQMLEEQRQKEEDESTKTRLLAQTHVTIRTLLECGDEHRLEQYLDTLYKEDTWDVFLCYIDLKVSNRALGMDPDELRKPARPTVQEYHEVIVSELKKYAEQRKKRKPRVIVPQVCICVLGVLYYITYVG